MSLVKVREYPWLLRKENVLGYKGQRMSLVIKDRECPSLGQTGGCCPSSIFAAPSKDLEG